RYSIQKNVPLLLEYLKRYQELHGRRFDVAFLGAGETHLGDMRGIVDLGFVDEATKRDVLAGAAALVQLSRNESLSLVVLEGWAQGVPVLAAADCAVLAGHLRRGGGGRTVDGYPSFAAALDHLWQAPEAWQRMGRQGREY